MKLKFIFFVFVSFLYLPILQATTVDADTLKVLKTKSVYAIQYVSPSDDVKLENIKNDFLNKLKSEHAIGNFQSLSYVYLSDDLTYLKSGFADGWVFDFKKVSSDNLRVRLLKFPESDVVWEESCPDASSCVNLLVENFASQSEGKNSTPVSSEAEHIPTLPPPPTLETPIPDSLFPDRGVYIDGGIGYAMLLKKEDRSVVKDSAWLNGRIGYQMSQKIGLHFEVGYSPLSVKTSVPISAYYFYLAPGIKCTIPLQDHLAIFVDGSLGYGRLNVRTTGYSGSGSGVHFGMEIGMTYKFNKWIGISPYLGLPSIMDAHASSIWFIPGIMGSFNF